MFAAFLEAGDHNSQVVLGLRNRANFLRSQLADGSSVVSSGGTTPYGGKEGHQRILIVNAVVHLVLCW